VRQFLPQIERSNAELLQRDPMSLDIEHIEESDEHVVEMDLGLGVFEQRLGRATRDSSSTSSASDSSSSSDPEEDENRDRSSPRLRSIRPLPKRPSPMIQVLASRQEGSLSTGDCPEL
ncbi:hypothetical protein DFH94DRAFT_790994, partial [Russula ochroleuca]